MGDDGSQLTIGYGQSDKPSGSKTHMEYSKRVMANDMVQLMYVPHPSLFSSHSMSTHGHLWPP